MLPFDVLDECFSVDGIIAALEKLDESMDWWQSVQSTAFVLVVSHPFFVRYLTGWILLLVLRWHSVQFTELLCKSRFFIVALEPVIPWHSRQYELFGRDRVGMASEELCIQPVLWHCET